MKACICRRPASGMVLQGLRSVARLVIVLRAGSDLGGVTVYITQNDGRGDIFPMSNRIVCADGGVSKFRTASLAAASARLFPWIFACAFIFL